MTSTPGPSTALQAALVAVEQWRGAGEVVLFGDVEEVQVSTLFTTPGVPVPSAQKCTVEDSGGLGHLGLSHLNDQEVVVTYHPLTEPGVGVQWTVMINEGCWIIRTPPLVRTPSTSWTTALGKP